MSAPMTIGSYLIKQLHNHGVRHVFGVPGDYSLLFLELLNKGPLQFVNTCDEQGAGFAADAYARLNGLAAACITYAVGSLKIANATAQAFAERSPIVVICGAPGLKERTRFPRLHHRVNEFDTQLKVFQQLTVAATVLSDPESAFPEIDRVLHAAEQHKRPVYIELPRDMVHEPGLPGHKHRDVPPASNGAALAEALAEAKVMLARARKPVILAGEEVNRFGLHRQLQRFAEQTNIPIATTFMGKSVVREDLPLFLGMYAGVVGPQAVCRYVESADCCLMLGAVLTDFDMGFFSAHLDRDRTILANADGVTIRHHHYEARMDHFMDGLLRAGIARKRLGRIPHLVLPAALRAGNGTRGRASSRLEGPALSGSSPATPGRPITVRRLFERINAFLTDDMIVLADVGDAMFGATELTIRHQGGLLCSGYYGNMGFAVPGAIGVQMLDRKLRPLVIVGDGAFQMTGMELSAAVRYGLCPIVIVLNNHGYATERFFIDGPFNELQPWAFSRVPELLGGGRGVVVHTEDELEQGLAAARANTTSFSILDVHIAAGDVSAGLSRLGRFFTKSTRG